MILQEYSPASLSSSQSTSQPRTTKTQALKRPIRNSISYDRLATYSPTTREEKKKNIPSRKASPEKRRTYQEPPFPRSRPMYHIHTFVSCKILVTHAPIRPAADHPPPTPEYANGTCERGKTAMGESWGRRRGYFTTHQRCAWPTRSPQRQPTWPTRWRPMQPMRRRQHQTWPTRCPLMRPT